VQRVQKLRARPRPGSAPVYEVDHGAGEKRPFHGGALGAGFVTAVWAETDQPVHRGGLFVLLIAMVCMALVGVFPTPSPLHFVAALSFFVFMTLGVGIFGAGDFAAALGDFGSCDYAQANRYLMAYARERKQFGQPIGDFQAIRFKLATMATKIEAARQLTHYVAKQKDEGGRCDMEACMAKYYASEVAEEVTSEGIQIHGGNGYTTDYPLERYWRDARLTRIFEGTSEIQQRVVADHLFDRGVEATGMGS